MADSVDTQATATSEQDTQQQGQQKSFTQEEVNELMGKLRRETKSKYADYDSLKEKAAKLDEIEEAQKTSEEKLQERLTSRILHHYFEIYSIHYLVLKQIFCIPNEVVRFCIRFARNQTFSRIILSFVKHVGHIVSP